MQIDAFALRLRRRNNLEATDLGVRLCQMSARSLFSCYLAVYLPVAAIALSCYPIARWLPGFLLWMSKPWLDRTVLFVLSRAAFGQKTTLAELWSQGQEVWLGQLAETLTLRRLCPWRALTQPVRQLEGLRGRELSRRASQIRRGKAARSAVWMGSMFNLAETVIVAGIVTLMFWLTPEGYNKGVTAGLMASNAWLLNVVATSGYALAVGFLEPFYVAAGFALYLNRRAELEAWDIEQELRRAFGG